MQVKVQFREAFARKIIKLRKQKDQTQEQVAGAIDIKLKTYAAYEERRSEPSISVLRRLAGFYGMTLDQLTNVDNPD
jgi:transcriptional regulator with XRE-family HTH domain